MFWPPDSAKQNVFESILKITCFKFFFNFLCFLSLVFFIGWNTEMGTNYVFVTGCLVTKDLKILFKTASLLRCLLCMDTTLVELSAFFILRWFIGQCWVGYQPKKLPLKMVRYKATMAPQKQNIKKWGLVSDFAQHCINFSLYFYPYDATYVCCFHWETVA